MQFLLILMRLTHILAGVAWAGGAFLLTGFVTPAAQKSGPAGGQVMQQMSGPGKMPSFMTAVALLTTLSGLYLFDVRSGHFNMDWITTPVGIALSIGALAGIAAFLHGLFATGPLTKKVAALGQEMAANQGPPSPEQLAQMGKLQEKLARNGRISALLLLITVGGMSLTGYI
ncbi:MAG: hypothetical protein GY796_14780 [Chloroflexi bacterium]|nr:hypothetical protein [Chloroflexota bacterium]